MADTNAAPRLWLMRATFLALAFVAVFLRLLPLETGPARWPAPDVLLALSLAWSLRRPEYVPALSVAATILLADFFFQRPPGLMAAIVVLACGAMRKRGPGLRDAGFLAELLLIALTILAVMLAYRTALTVFVLPRPPLGMTLLQAVFTMAIYPFVALASQLCLGVRARTNAELAAGRMT
ncbi:rod shape-determining protein MreD [Marinovum sp. 2_MG-2023]|uniref:rod shape-determining protein MreD n=1 Tax=Roseobacteraceae TaxID=2854170 RepID=UPI001FD366FE|nr:MULTISPECIES: rod shape-determining protein MreD [Roseobacteraceae]MCJ7871622.1 rod shape-determining protein MreD [Phaeobacter sp. J2-8]MDO6728454.1 rod shape-determining protein MreD [Marinovum sp. 2_MG-2023]MDO6778130.1 rod shape-determining protein MreD [Marinovum sp. 1_MG-2023]